MLRPFCKNQNPIVKQYIKGIGTSQKGGVTSIDLKLTGKYFSICFIL